MTNLLLTLLFDFLLAVLLIVTINYCSKLSRRIRMLQDSRSELAGMITQFDTATERAMASLAELQTVSKRITDALQMKIEKANFLADDLAFLIEKSSKLVTQLEHTKTPHKETTVNKPKPIFEPKALFEKPGQQFVTPRTGLPPRLAEEDLTPSQVASSLEAVLQRLTASTSSSSSPKSSLPQPAMTQPALRTDAERELQQALKSGR